MRSLLAGAGPTTSTFTAVYVGINSKATDIGGLQSLVSAIFNTTAYAVGLEMNAFVGTRMKSDGACFRCRALFILTLAYLSQSEFAPFFTAKLCV